MLTCDQLQVAASHQPWMAVQPPRTSEHGVDQPPARPGVRRIPQNARELELHTPQAL